MKRAQGFICGFLAAIILLISVPALAESIQAKFNVLNIKVNGELTVKAGESFTLPDGRKVPYTIVYSDTTYLPLRETVRLVGKDLSFDGATSTADIINKPTQRPVEPPKTEGDVVSENKYVTRAELARFIVQSLGLKDNGAECKFEDVSPTHEYYKDIKIAFQQGIMNYTFPLNFGPDDLMTRWQYSGYLARALKINGTVDDTGVVINDIDKIMIASHNTIKKLISIGAMQLDENGNFNPNDYILSPLTPNPNLKNYIQE